MSTKPNVPPDSPQAAVQHRGGGVLRWAAISILVAVIGLTIVADVMLRRAGPILKGRAIETLSTRFNSKVELDAFQVSVAHGIDVSGQGLRIFAPDDIVAAGARAPLISIREFSFHAGLRSLFLKPTRIGAVHVSGMTISIPPRQIRRPGTFAKRRGKIKVIVDTLVFDDSRLVLQNSRPDKDQKTFELHHIELHNYGGASPSSYDAMLSNAIPRGEIHAVGRFGPWNTESPGDSSISGHYVFDHADLKTVPGIAGILHSVGDFSGQLNRMEVTGMTETPDFSLDSADHPMALRTTFHAVVDGLSGDTYLQPVRARLASSTFTCTGDVINIRGKGHLIDLDVDLPNGRIEDFLRLAVKGHPMMTGRLQMHSRLSIPPGHESVIKKIELKSDFSLHDLHLTNPTTENKIDQLSLRAQGRPKEVGPGAPDVQSMMQGRFVMRSGRMNFSRLEYQIPGGDIQLAGTFEIAEEQIDFTGEIRTKAKLSQMVASRWKSWLLKPVDPFFHKDGSGAVIPIRLSGTKDSPNFALDFAHHRAKTRETPAPR